jgi:hypothetical protein
LPSAAQGAFCEKTCSGFCIEPLRHVGDLFFEQRAVAEGCFLVLIKPSFDRRGLLFRALKGDLFLLQRFAERRL